MKTSPGVQNNLYDTRMYSSFVSCSPLKCSEALNPLPLQTTQKFVPQLPYRSDVPQVGWTPEESIFFFTDGNLGVKAYDAYSGVVDGMCVVSTPYNSRRQVITIRIHVRSGGRLVIDSSL